MTMKPKKPTHSKTININLLLTLIVSLLAGFDVELPPEVWVGIAGATPLLNILLRFITKGAISFTNQNQQTGSASTRAIIILLASSILAMAAFTGCAKKQTIYTPEAYPDSWIVQVCADRGWSPEDIASLSVDLSIIGIGLGAYDKADAMQFISDFRAAVQAGISYRYLIAWLVKYQDRLTATEGALAMSGMIVLSRNIGAFDSTRIVSRDDQRILLDLADYWQREINFYVKG